MSNRVKCFFKIEVNYFSGETRSFRSEYFIEKVSNCCSVERLGRKPN